MADTRRDPRRKQQARAAGNNTGQSLAGPSHQAQTLTSNMALDLSTPSFGQMQAAGQLTAVAGTGLSTGYVPPALGQNSQQVGSANSSSQLPQVFTSQPVTFLSSSNTQNRLLQPKLIRQHLLLQRLLLQQLLPQPRLRKDHWYLLHNAHSLISILTRYSHSAAPMCLLLDLL